MHSGLPLRTAARRCPDAVFLAVDREAYEAASAEVMAALREFGAVLEVQGWDEAFLGIESEDPEGLARTSSSGSARRTRPGLHGRDRAEQVAGQAGHRLRQARRDLPADRCELVEVLGDRPTDALWGIGQDRQAARGLGIGTVAELAAADPDALAAQFGPATGPWLVLLARGHGERTVDDTPYRARSHGREVTFQENIADWARVTEEIARLAGAVAGELAGEQRPAVRVVVKVRYAPFFTETHGHALAAPTSDAAAITTAALAALELFTGRRPVRLLGVRAEFAAAPDPRAS